MKQYHEVRDAIHNFIHYTSAERKVINSKPVQRLRHIHQLGLTSLVYPGATHKRFEHSLGVMELAGRVYDIVTNRNNIHETVRDIIPQDDHLLVYWRQVLRIAALCHDIGHLPFSHAAQELLPDGWDHERLTSEMINSDEMKYLWGDLKIDANDIAKIAIGPKKYKEAQFSTWEALLTEIIVGDAFGVDRMDYLLRDSHHAGVAYGSFDHYRLIESLRILPMSQEEGSEPSLGVQEGGLHCAEALIIARYFMYTQVYFHPIRRIYDIHLMDFLIAYFEKGHFSTDINDHFQITDNEITSAILVAARDSKHRCHEPARRIVNREHYRLLYNRNPEDIRVNPGAAKAIFDATCEEFGEDFVRFDQYKQKGGSLNFPVLKKDNRIIPSWLLSKTMETVPVVAVDFVFIAPSKRELASRWLEENREQIIAPKKEQAS